MVPAGVFGDMDLLAAAQTGSPRAIFADFLFASEANVLEFAAEPRTDLKQGSGQLQMLRDAVGHDAFLVDAPAAGGRRYTIVSPWVIATTMERVGLLAAFEAAVRRGTEIDVFADPLLNMGQAAGGVAQMEAVEKAFSRIGVRLHSKIVAIDTDLFCIGSYNWLSADRHGQYARHEISRRVCVRTESHDLILPPQPKSITFPNGWNPTKPFVYRHVRFALTPRQRLTSPL